MQPAVLLLDEPLSNLDARLRLEMRTELQRLKREIGVTMIHVTHDQEEALTLGDRIAVLRDGALQQLASPEGDPRHPGEHLRGGLHREPAHQLVSWAKIAGA